MKCRTLLSLLAIGLFMLPAGCVSGERSLTLAGPRRDAKLAVSTEPKDRHEDHVIIVED